LGHPAYAERIDVAKFSLKQRLGNDSGSHSGGFETENRRKLAKLQHLLMNKLFRTTPICPQAPPEEIPISHTYPEIL
jgi:hypothetical protein